MIVICFFSLVIDFSFSSLSLFFLCISISFLIRQKIEHNDLSLLVKFTIREKIETMVKQLFQLTNLESQLLIKGSLRQMHKVSCF
jgi:hypothetical protein